MTVKIFNYHIIRHAIHNRYYDLVIADTLRSAALSMVALFVPLFLLKKGYEIGAIAVYYLCFYILSTIGHYVLLKVINKIGIKKSLIISYAAEIIFCVVLYNYEKISVAFGDNFYFLFLIIPAVVAVVFYWTAHHIYFFVSTHVKNEGVKLGFLYAIPAILTIFTPFLGGFLITTLGFKLTFVVSAILLIFASAVLFLSKSIKARVDIQTDKIFDFYRDNKNWIYFVEGVDYFAAGIIWPIYMFFMSISFLSIGFIYIFANIAYVVSCYVSGKISDKIGTRNLGRAGVIGHAASLALRAFSERVLSMSIALTLGGLFTGAMQVSLESAFFKHSHKNIGSAIMNRELYMHLGRIFMVLLFLFCLLIYNIHISLVFILLFSAFATFMLNFVIKKDKIIID
ncbi:MFS transporter [Candidatus Parcubacteria bacterium]|nr:MFS transporter [Candidatus Parcubacteria bacterium]